MIPVLIVEGPDGSGKTTLVHKLIQEFDISQAPRASDSVEGPVKNLTKWVDDDLLHWGFSPIRIYDRYPLISEPIYGPLIRGSVPDRFTDKWMRSRMNSFRSMSLVIWCIPPFKVVDKNVSESDNQMRGVQEDIDAIWHMYAVQAHTWSGNGVIYDYTQENTRPRDTHLVNLIRRHLMNWRYFSHD